MVRSEWPFCDLKKTNSSVFDGTIFSIKIQYLFPITYGLRHNRVHDKIIEMDMREQKGKKRTAVFLQHGSLLNWDTGLHPVYAIGTPFTNCLRFGLGGRGAIKQNTCGKIATNVSHEPFSQKIGSESKLSETLSCTKSQCRLCRHDLLPLQSSNRFTTCPPLPLPATNKTKRS